MAPIDLVSRIRAASREIVRQAGVLRNRFQSIGSPSLCHALVELDTQKEMTIGKLSLVLGLDQSTTSRLIDQMIKEGMCQTQPSENDRRHKLVSLTKKGTKLVSIIHQEATTQVQQALDLLNPEERQEVVNGLSLYAKALHRSNLQKEYEIRKLAEKDVAQLIQLTRSVWAEFGFGPNHPDAPFFEAELHASYKTYSAKRSAYFVLVRGTKIMGGAGFCPLAGEANICELKGMYLSPTTRGLGLGTILLEHTLERAKQAGFKECYLETMDFMHAANSLYRKFGFLPLDRPKGNTGHTWTNCWYIKKI